MSADDLVNIFEQLPDQPKGSVTRVRGPRAFVKNIRHVELLNGPGQLSPVPTVQSDHTDVIRCNTLGVSQRFENDSGSGWTPVGTEDEGGRAMPMPSKGDRTSLTVRLPSELIDTLKAQRSSAGATSLSQYVADLIAIASDREDLARELNRAREQGVLPLTA
ncbi:hypothetical protein [Rhodococcus sp. 06-235-1A]|uniref:hypothetical protein n=1 Tax=Rhodococcus sp. 06-235-1A TaxID=2022508 RepID=UPI001179FF25|nr:hypothetical protein [Rhodococcus sp. 06-235-1A]